MVECKFLNSMSVNGFTSHKHKQILVHANHCYHYYSKVKKKNDKFIGGVKRGTFPMLSAQRHEH